MCVNQRVRVPIPFSHRRINDGSNELERVVPVGEAILPFFWVTGPADDVNAFSAAAREEQAIEGLTAVDTIADRTLFRAKWADDVAD